MKFTVIASLVVRNLMKVIDFTSRLHSETFRAARGVTTWVDKAKVYASLYIAIRQERNPLTKNCLVIAIETMRQ